MFLALSTIFIIYEVLFINLHIQQYMLNSIISKFTSGDKRTAKAKKNIVASLGVKFVDSLVYFLLVPVTLGYLNAYEYGIWLTLSSILMWVNTFDVGLGNGLRNRLAEAMAKDDKELGRAYVSTTFFMLVAIVVVAIALMTITSGFIDWHGILGVSKEQIPNLDGIIYLAFLFFCLNFVLRFVGNVYMALQLPAVNNMLVVTAHALSLIVIYILTKTTEGNLLLVAVVYSASTPLVYLIAYPITFRIVYRYLAPSLRYFRRRYVKDLISISFLFFFIQIADIALFTLSNVVLSRELGPESVTSYNITYRYFSIMSMVMTLIIMPMWSATTDAYTRGDIAWIRTTLRKIHKILLLALFATVIMVIGSKLFYHIWIGGKIDIPYTYSAMMGLYVMVLMWEMAYSTILNGIGMLKVRATVTSVMVASFYPLSIFLIPYFGVLGVLGSLIIVNMIGGITYPCFLNGVISKKKV